MKRPEIKDKRVLEYVSYLEKEIGALKESPVLSTYLTLKQQIEDWNSQLSIDGTVVSRMMEDDDGEDVIGSVRKGHIDLFSPKDDKSFDRAFKYFSDVVTLHKQLEDLKKMMSPEQMTELEKKMQKKGGGIAETLASNGAG